MTTNTLLETIDEYLRTFAGVEGVLGALGVYRAAFETIAQTAPLTHNKVKIPVVALGGEKSLGALVGKFVSMVASNVQSKVIPSCGHFIPEEAAQEAVVEQVRVLDRGGPSVEMTKTIQSAPCHQGSYRIFGRVQPERRHSLSTYSPKPSKNMPHQVKGEPKWTS